MDLNTVWFVLLGILLTGYAILDGFDLGVGTVYLAVRKDEERRILLNSIGPLWDGNEVWLVTFGGALFAAFPNAYASIFSGFYSAFMLVLAALIIRAVSIEFRSKHEGRVWRASWDVLFSAASIVATFVFGVAVGNCIWGLPIRADGELSASLLSLLHPYPVLVGLLTVAGVAMHGSLYLYLKTEGELQKRIHDWVWTTFGIFLVFYMLATVFTLAKVPHAVRNFERAPWAWTIVVANVLAIANIPRAIYLGRPVYAFLSSCATIAALIVLFGAALFPNIVVSSGDPAHSLTIYGAASSAQTLKTMLVIAIVGMPFVLAYTAVIYWTFRGKVQVGRLSY
ncbi:MAG: cytochrome d ubiquinol oxidase subunit II [Planctomycetota bacterium]|nr:cytochrome d ubiquinol oxidase subunit II [Planctomycetota bacterium]